MKTNKILLLIIFCFAANAISAQTKLYYKFAPIKDDVKSVYIADVDKLTGCTGCGCTNLIGDNLKQLLTSDIDLQRIKTLVMLKSITKAGKLQLQTEIDGLIGEGRYENLLLSRDRHEIVSIYKTKNGDSEILIISEDDNTLTVTQLIGNFANHANGKN